MLTEEEIKNRIKANNIAKKFMDIISTEARAEENVGSPREQVVFGCHVVGNLFARMCIALKGYGELNNISELDVKNTKKLINKITNAYIKTNLKE